MKREPLDYLGPVLTVAYLLLGAIQWRWGSHLVAWLLFAFALWNVGFLFLWALVFVGSRGDGGGCSRCGPHVPMLANTEDWARPLCADCYVDAGFA